MKAYHRRAGFPGDYSPLHSRVVHCSAATRAAERLGHDQHAVQIPMKACVPVAPDEKTHQVLSSRDRCWANLDQKNRARQKPCPPKTDATSQR
jgi:hypothetical protein